MASFPSLWQSHGKNSCISRAFTIQLVINSRMIARIYTAYCEENPSKDRGVRERHIADLLTCDTTLWDDTMLLGKYLDAGCSIYCRIL